MKPTAVFRALLTLTIAAGFPLLGCSGNGLRLAKVSGTVKYKGQPVTNGTVFFMPDEKKGTVGPPAMAAIANDGSYVLSTETTGDGVIYGNHLVGITGLEANPVSEEVAPDPETNPEAYLKGKAREAAIARGEMGAAAAKKEAETFTDRGGRRYRYVIPKRFSNPEESGIMVKIDGPRTIHFDIEESGQVKITP